MEAEKKSQVIRRLFLALVVAAVVGLAWLTFRFVINDARLFLEYLQVLVWPLVVLGVLSILRKPVEEKVRQLLRLDAFGASAQFSPEAQGRRLARELDGDLHDLFDVIEPDDGEADPVSEGPSTAKEGEGKDQAGLPQGELTPNEQARAQGRTPTGMTPSENPRSSDGPAVDLDDFLEVARLLGVPLGVRVDLREQALRGDKGAVDALRVHVEGEAQRARSARNQALHRPEETRERIEAVIRTSASWGYGMGRAGAPEAVPDIAWNKDGTWQITTEVPKAKATPKRASEALVESNDDMREVRELVKEIKEIERKRHSGNAAMSGLLAFQNDGWLKELKRRLAMVDPGNPWTR